jgi:hypothetical protein
LVDPEDKLDAGDKEELLAKADEAAVKEDWAAKDWMEPAPTEAELSGTLRCEGSETAGWELCWLHPAGCTRDGETLGSEAREAAPVCAAASIFSDGGFSAGNPCPTQATHWFCNVLRFWMP